MIRIASLAIGMAVAVVSFPVAIAGDAASAPTAATTAGADQDPVICKREEATGSRLGGKKVCKTKSQWADDAEQTKSTMRTINIKGASGPAMSTGG